MCLREVLLKLIRGLFGHFPNSDCAPALSSLKWDFWGTFIRADLSKFVAVESFGAWHPSAVAEVVKLGSALACQNGDEESVTIQRLFQQFSVALMRGNAALLNNRQPSETAGGNEDEIVW